MSEPHSPSRTGSAVRRLGAVPLVIIGVVILVLSLAFTILQFTLRPPREEPDAR